MANNRDEELDATTLTGTALAAAVERIVFGDDLSCFAADGTERRERILSLMESALVSSSGCSCDEDCEDCQESCRQCDVCRNVDVWYASWDGRQRVEVPEPRGRVKPWAEMVWDNRHGTTREAFLNDLVSSYRAIAPRPFDSDPGLALGLLFSKRGGELSWDFSGVYMGRSGADYSEFPDSPPEQQRVLAFCAAVCRAALAAAAAKERANATV